ncbi:MAG TPA: hypothetical protein VGV39_04575 [Mesorhizobium sp.]|uniref:hypothetical protein n=1 Tax=Mesorhizobium sp. TaxID=1871066 RepID=UPI002DDD9F20|nr:hypothetical protein [Mesorhizobium sp.]HEV2502323.1 hypothetical protein [Mesorhizobium sp.]
MTISAAFWDWVGDRWRGRWVLPGYNARDTNVPRNKVVLDTDDIGTLSKLANGQATLSYGGSLDTGAVTIGTWPDPGFVPLCTFHFSIAGGEWDNVYTMQNTGSASGNYYIKVSRTGIVASLKLINSTSPVTIAWTAFRLPVM